MKSDHLVRHYEHLTARERLALVLAACERGDDVEQQRLTFSAPRQGLTAPHHFGLTQAFLLLSILQFMELLELAGGYLAALNGIGAKRPPEREAAWDTTMLLGYYFRTNLEGWRRFCAGMDFAPEVLWQGYPGYRTLRCAERATGRDPRTGSPGTAYVAEGVARRRAGQAVGEAGAELDAAALAAYWPVTAEQVAAELRETWEQLEATWGRRLG